MCNVMYYGWCIWLISQPWLHMHDVHAHLLGRRRCQAWLHNTYICHDQLQWSISSGGGGEYVMSVQYTTHNTLHQYTIILQSINSESKKDKEYQK